MSTRLYPIYKQGNPQLRIYMPNFWMKLVSPDVKQPPNIVKFIVSNEMTNHDIKNYLEKIYKVPVAEVRSNIVTGEFRRVRAKGYIVKDDDYRQAYVTLQSGITFEFPNLFPKDEHDKRQKAEETTQNEIIKNFKRYEEKNKNRPGIPGWFGL